MNNAKKLLALACATALLSLPAMAQDKAKPADDKKAAPAAAAKPAEAKKDEGTTKVLVDNDKVRVTEVTYKPGAGSTMREPRPRLPGAMTHGQMERTPPDGKKKIVQGKAGEAEYFPHATLA